MKSPATKNHVIRTATKSRDKDREKKSSSRRTSQPQSRDISHTVRQGSTTSPSRRHHRSPERSRRSERRSRSRSPDRRRERTKSPRKSRTPPPARQPRISGFSSQPPPGVVLPASLKPAVAPVMPQMAAPPPVIDPVRIFKLRVTMGDVNALLDRRPTASCCCAGSTNCYANEVAYLCGQYPVRCG